MCHIQPVMFAYLCLNITAYPSTFIAFKVLIGLQLSAARTVYYPSCATCCRIIIAPLHGFFCECVTKVTQNNNLQELSMLLQLESLVLSILVLTHPHYSKYLAPFLLGFSIFCYGAIN